MTLTAHVLRFRLGTEELNSRRWMLIISLRRPSVIIDGGDYFIAVQANEKFTEPAIAASVIATD